MNPGHQRFRDSWRTEQTTETVLGRLKFLEPLETPGMMGLVTEGFFFGFEFLFHAGLPWTLLRSDGELSCEFPGLTRRRR